MLTVLSQAAPGQAAASGLKFAAYQTPSRQPTAARASTTPGTAAASIGMRVGEGPSSVAVGAPASFMDPAAANLSSLSLSTVAGAKKWGPDGYNEEVKKV
jgi:hypothetical protein